MTDDYKSLLAAALLDESQFISAAFSGSTSGGSTAGGAAWVRLNIRPVQLKGRYHWQFAYFNGTQTITKNYTAETVAPALDEALALPFRNFHVQTQRETLQVNLSKKGKPLVSRKRHSTPPPAPELAHDRPRQTLLTPDGDAALFLRQLGMLTADGRIRADMAHKFQQINDYLRLVADSGALAALGTPGQTLHVVDFGCGNAYLTFATYFYLTQRLHLRVQMTGVDLKAHLMERHNANAQALGWEGLRFHAGAILDYEPTDNMPPQFVMALHACDTATDDALAQGIRWGSELIVAAPCCHHDLQAQLAKAPTPPTFAPVLRYGILFERMGDALTDSFRALILRMAGYRVDLVEFVDAEHTPKNLMIRALRGETASDSRAAEEYAALKAFWGVTPHLETLLSPP